MRVSVPAPTSTAYFEWGKDPIDDEITDASVNLDRYLQHFTQAGFTLAP
ncbi:MAG TPA: hypothetical protein VKY74_09155 [Chloroflexia bacterium]|nr:hypothetical protein [Chloroflexia bacterium]